MQRPARFGTPAVWEAAALALLVVGSAVLAVAYVRWPASGLAARYWSNPRWEGSPAVTGRRDAPTGETLVRRLPPASGGLGSAEWTGFLAVEQAGRYVFDITSDGRFWLWIDKTLVASGEGRSDAGASGGAITLTTGAHPIMITYAGRSGPAALAVVATGPDGVPSALETRSLAPSAAAARRGWWRRITRYLPMGLAASWALLMLYLPARLGLWWALATIRPFVRNRRARLVAWALLACSVALLAWGITWGLPATGTTWAPDESDPENVIAILQPRPLREWPALGSYPPLYYYVTAPPIAGFVLADHFHILRRTTEAWQTAAQIFMRATTVLMALATLVAVAACAAEAAGATSAAFAVLALLLTPPFVYYGKTANVDIPYLVWLSVALLAFVRIIKRDQLRDYLVLGAAAAAAVATKDQAYGFFVLVPAAIVVTSVRHRAREGHPAPWRALLTDRKLLYAGLLSIAVFVFLYNMAFNWRGFVDHIRLIRGFGEAARDFPATFDGQIRMAGHSARTLRWNMGWPLLLLAVAGVARAFWRREDRWLLWLLVPAATYYLTFIAASGVAYDRFFFGVMAILAIFAGVACEWIWRGPRRVLGRGLILLAMLYSLSYAGSIDVMMVRDARYAAEAWMSKNIPVDMPVGMLVPPLYAPRVGARPRIELEASLEGLIGPRPCFVVVNTRYAARYADSAAGQELLAALARGALGYREVFRYRGTLPAWATLQYEREVRAPYENRYSNLDKINPEIVIYRGCPADQRF